MKGDILIIPTDRQPELYRKAYDASEQVIQEMKEKCQSYLPSDFDWNGHIGTVLTVREDLI